jgi:hypothetical protein
VPIAIPPPLVRFPIKPPSTPAIGKQANEDAQRERYEPANPTLIAWAALPGPSLSNSRDPGEARETEPFSRSRSNGVLRALGSGERAASGALMGGGKRRPSRTKNRDQDRAASVDGAAKMIGCALSRSTHAWAPKLSNTSTASDKSSSASKLRS